MKLKTVDVNGTTYAEVRDNKPLFVHDDGKEVAFDVPAAVQAIATRNGEAMRHREARERAEAELAQILEKFAGIDPQAARKALDTVKNLDEGQLYTAGKVEEIKAAAKRAAEEQVAAAAKASADKIRELTDQLGRNEAAFLSEKLAGAFSRSKFIAEKVAVPADMVQAMFGSRFKIENERIVGLGLDGQPIYSRSKAGEIADFDEAIESMIDAYPNRDAILKGTGGGSGARAGNGVGAGARTMLRAAFAKLSPADQMARIRDGVSVIDDR